MASIPGAAGPGAPFPQWTVSTEDYQVAEVTSAAGKALAEASVFPNKLIFFTSQSAAETYAKAHGGGTDLTALQPAVNAVGDAAGAASNVTSWEQGLTTFLGDLTSKNTYLRAAKIITGIVMIVVGLAKITGTDKAITTAARKVVV